MIPYGRQSISQSDIDAVVDVLHSDWLTQGPAVARFENALATYCGAPYAVATSSGTAALHLACLAAGFGRGDILWTTPNTFVASANCALYCGGEVDFVDIDARSYNLCPDALERKLQQAERDGRLPKVVVPVHFAGQSCDMARIGALADRYGFLVVEDASHAVGGTYRDAKIGSCRHAHMTVFSFHPVKIITTGEGGMVMTRDRPLYDRLMRLRSHGIDRSAASGSDAEQGGWYYAQTELGYNYRMTDLQAALGTSQLRRIDEFVAARRALAERYDRMLADLPLTLPWQDPHGSSARHLYPLQLHAGAATRHHVYDRLHAQGVRCQVHYIPVHTQPFFHARGFRAGDFPIAEAYYSGALSLPLYPGLGADEQDRVISALRESL